MIKTPTCPVCGQLPARVLSDGHQAFCPTDSCRVITWDTHLTAEENRANTTAMKLSRSALDAVKVVRLGGGRIRYSRADIESWLERQEE